MRFNAKVALQPSWSLLINVEHENANNGQPVDYCPPNLHRTNGKAPWRTPLEAPPWWISSRVGAEFEVLDRR